MNGRTHCRSPSLFATLSRSLVPAYVSVSISVLHWIVSACYPYIFVGAALGCKYIKIPSHHKNLVNLSVNILSRTLDDRMITKSGLPTVLKELHTKPPYRKALFRARLRIDWPKDYPSPYPYGTTFLLVSKALVQGNL